MEDLILKLVKEKISFSFTDDKVVVGSYDTGYYGVIDTEIAYNETNKEYYIEYGNKGYPYGEFFEDVDKLIKFIKELV